MKGFPYYQGEILIVQKDCQWHDDGYPGHWHNVSKGEKFEFEEYSYGEYLRCRNTQERYSIYLTEESWKNLASQRQIKEIRKSKLETIEKTS